jgi:hypothetical protein
MPVDGAVVIELAAMTDVWRTSVHQPSSLWR